MILLKTSYKNTNKNCQKLDCLHFSQASLGINSMKKSDDPYLCLLSMSLGTNTDDIFDICIHANDDLTSGG